jgi:hypothetical protein
MRKLLALCALAAAAAVVVPADLPAAPVQATLSGSITGGGAWCCGEYADIEGVGTVASVGRVSFLAYWETGCDRPEIGFPHTCWTYGKVVLTAKNGDTVTLDGYSDSSYSPAVPWAVLDGTGRFASASGNGTLSFNVDSNAMTATIAMTGTLSR